MSRSRTRSSYMNMHSRCLNPKTPYYSLYGGRGISICERWLKNYPNFFADMGERPLGKNLDRIDSEGHYGPDNCRWASVDEQLVNRCNTIYLTIDGVTKPYIEWERASGLPKRLIYNRLIAGWDEKQAVMTPKAKYVRRSNPSFSLEPLPE